MIFAAALLAAAPPATPSVAYRIDPQHRIVEGIASDGKGLWLSSIIDRVVLRCTSTCRPAFTLAGPGHPLGIAWDADRKWLWIAMHCPELKGSKPCDGELRAVDRSGRTRYSGRPGTDFRPGDVSVFRGIVTVSDSGNGAVHRLYRGEWTTPRAPGQGKSAQGSAFFGNGRTQVVSDYGLGIATFPMPPVAAPTWTKAKDGRTIQGIDGMTSLGSRIFGVYNGRSPGKLLEFAIERDRISYDEVPDGGLLPDPTQVAIHAGALFVVGDSGWAGVDSGPVRTSGATIVRIPLPKSVR